MYKRYKDRAGFLFVYIDEAHPEDGWQMDSNTDEDVVFERPRTWSARRDIAESCCQKLELSMPVVVDDTDNTVDNLYAGWPERMFVINSAGTVAYAGAQGPWGFKVDEVEKALKRLLR